MRHHESYVAEAKARRRRRITVGIVGAVMLATVALTALLVLNPPTLARAPLSAACVGEPVPSAAVSCERANARRAG